MTPIDADAVAVLSALLRARPTDLDQLHRAATLPASRFEAAVVALTAAGFIVIDGEHVEVVDPEQPFTGVLEHLLAEQHGATAELAALLATLPSVGRDARRGDGDRREPVPTERVHGTRNQWELWMRLMSETPPRAPIATFPDFPGLATIVLENLPMLKQAREALGFGIRTIATAEALADPLAREQVTAMASAGVEIRTLATLPGWFYVDGGVLAALPLTWGEAVPTSIALVREPTLLAPLQEFAERLWARATPLPTDPSGWDPVLELLAQGLSDGAIATALGQSLRTVRRRIADAGEAFGAGTRFALGAEWARRR